MANLQLFKRKPVLRGWFLSYLFVLAIPILLCLAIFWCSYKTIRAESEKMYSSSLEQVRIDFDAHLDELQQILDQVLLTSAVQKSTRIPYNRQPEDQLTLVDVRDELSHAKLSHPYVDDVYIALNQPDGIICSTGYADQALFYDIYYKSSSTTLQQFQAFLRAPHPRWDMTVMDCGNRSYLLFARTTLDNNFSHSTGTAVVVVDRQNFTDRLRQFQWDDRLNLFVLRPSGQVICHTGDTSSFSIPYSDLRAQDTFRFVTSGGVHGGMLVRPSASTNWRYVLLASDSLLQQSARRIQLYTLFGFLACTIVGLVVSMRLAQRNYHPLSLLMARFAQQGTPPESTALNEYDQLNQYLQQFFKQNGDAQTALWNSQQMLRKYYLYSVLERPYQADRVALANRRYHVTWDGPNYLVVLFSNPFVPLEDETGDTGRFPLLQFVILNIFKEVASAHFSLEMTDAGENAAAILNLPDADPHHLVQLEEDIRFTQGKIQEHFHTLVTAAVSDLHEGPEGIHYAYLEALEALSLLRDGDETDIVAYRDVRDARGSYAFPLEAEQKLIDLIVAGRADGAKELLARQLYTSPLKNAALPAGVVRCLAFDITAALMKGANQAGIDDFSGIDFVELEHCPASQLQARFDGVVDALCQRINEKAATVTPSAQLCEEMRTYIRTHYMDPDLNISQTGLHFNMTPTYLSAIFKKESGGSLMGFINEVRIGAAKELLASGLTVAQIAEQVGFRDSGSLIRVFKKETGLTPGQYKSVHTTAER